MEVVNSKELREKVAAWINSKSKNVNAGLEIFKQTNFKPQVYEIFYKNSTRPDIPRKLEIELRLYLRYHFDPSVAKKENFVENDFIQQKTVLDPFEAKLEKELNNNEYPVEIKKLIAEHSRLYKMRSTFHNQLKKSGEGNSAEETTFRKDVLKSMDKLSTHIDKLWDALSEYKSTGNLPEPSLYEIKIELIPSQKKADDDDDKKVFELGKTKAELENQYNNWRIKLSRAENRLKFQNIKKQPKLNPMPAGPKRIKLEKLIARLRSEKLAIDTRLAELS